MSEPSTRASDEPVRRVFPVGRLLTGLAKLLDDRVGRQWIVGEISDLHAARSGHVYFSLKDDEGQIRALTESCAQPAHRVVVRTVVDDDDLVERKRLHERARDLLFDEARVVEVVDETGPPHVPILHDGPAFA